VDTVLDGLFWVFFIAWQATPVVLPVLLWRDASLSLAAMLVAVVLTVAGTALAWYWAMSDTSSSTATLLLVVSPFYIGFAVLAVFGVDFAVRTARRRRLRT
jgi:hypothetical protein